MNTRSASFDAALREHIAALQARDIERFALTLSRSPNLRLVGPHGEMTVGFDAVVASHAAWFAAADVWSFDCEELWRQTGSDAALTLHAVTYRDTPTAAPIRFLLAFAFLRERDGAWRLIYDQNTPLS